MWHWIASLISPMALFWLAAMIILLIAEASTVGLVSVWFAGGSLAALIVAGTGGPLWLQITLFLVVSALLLALVRPLMKKVIMPKTTATNLDRHLGRVALVTEEIDNLKETGAVKLDGVVWTARSENGDVVPVGTAIEVLRIEGVRAIVASAEQPAVV